MIKAHHLFVIICLPFFFSSLQAQVVVESDSLYTSGQTNYSSDFFKDRILHNSFGSFVDNYNDFLIFQTTSHGDLHTPDQLFISIQGNSYRWNKYYQDGFRIDHRANPGSYLYEQDMYKRSLNIDIYNSKISFHSDNSTSNAILLRYNHGNVGGVTSGTQQFFNLFHKSALETVHKPIEARRNMNGQGVAHIDYNIEHNGQVYHQYLYAGVGQRELVAFDYKADNWAFYEDYAKVEIGGQLPTSSFGLMDELHYAMAFSTRDHFNHELYYGVDETSKSDKYSVSLFGKRKRQSAELTTGFTAVQQVINHNDPNFSRNLMDIDGESLSPFYADANITELSHFINYKYQLLDNLEFEAEGYNSLIGSRPNAEHMSNPIYFESVVSPIDDSWLDEANPYYTSLQVHHWESNAFASGLLENYAALNYSSSSSSKVTFTSKLAVTLDGMLVSDKSVVKPNWEADVSLKWQPNSNFSTALNVSRKRIAFHYDMIKYVSDDYLNGEVYYWNDGNNDKLFQEEEQSAYLTSEGGTHRQISNDIEQPAYFMIDWPLIVKAGKKHTFSMVTTYKKFYNMWQTELVGQAEDYGYYVKEGSEDIYFLNDGAVPEYEINSHAPAGMAFDEYNSFLTNTPFSFTNIVKYSYRSHKTFFSLSWVSQFMMTQSTLGNSPVENNMEVFSDALALPNGQKKSAARPQQDRGYVARILYGRQFNEHWKGSFLFKFVDGQPFAKYDTKVQTNANGDTQMATWRYLNSGASPLYGWGDREDMGFNTELRIAYTFKISQTEVEMNLAGYNLIDFGYELISNGYDIPEERRRSSVEICAPRGFMFTTKFTL